jgi:anti-anti-sigma factor
MLYEKSTLLDLYHLDHHTTVIELDDRIDYESINSIRSQVMDVTKTSSKVLVLDMQNVSFIDSSGLGLLISVMKVMRAKNGKLVLSGMNENISSLIEITQIDHLFEICDRFSA